MMPEYKTKEQQRKFYKSNIWRGVNGIRNQIIARDKECVMCKEEGKVNTADMTTLEVDHILELEHCTYEQAIDLNNLRALCNRHHNLRHNHFNGKKLKESKWAYDEKW